jgi:hypothetical protein
MADSLLSTLWQSQPSLRYTSPRRRPWRRGRPLPRWKVCETYIGKPFGTRVVPQCDRRDWPEPYVVTYSSHLSLDYNVIISTELHVYRIEASCDTMKIPPAKHPLDSHYAATRVFRAVKQVLTSCSPLHHPRRYLAVTRRVTQVVVIRWSPERSPMWSPAVYPCVPH